MNDDRVYVLHIRDAIQNIFDDTFKGRDVFFSDRRRRDAVVRNLEIIGEATKNLSAGIRAQHSEVPWQLMAGMRDRLIHGYFGVDYGLVWRVVEQDLPDLMRDIQSILAELDPA